MTRIATFLALTACFAAAEGVGWVEHPLDTHFAGGVSVSAAHVNADLYPEIIAAADLDNQLVWYENDCSGGFTLHVIDSTYAGAHHVFAADVDGDRDVDIVTAAYWIDDVSWWENNGGNFTRHVVDSNLPGAHFVCPIDINRDSATDILAAGYDDNKILLYRNDGSQVFSRCTVGIYFYCPFSVHAADVDDDGDIDVLGAALNRSELAWWRNDGDTAFTKQEIARNYTEAASICGVELDRDDDVDVISVGLAGRLSWWENVPVGIAETRGPAKPARCGPTLTSDRHLPPGTSVYDVSGRRVAGRLAPGVYHVTGGDGTRRQVVVR